MALLELFYRDHITFTSVGEIKELARPLRQIGINYFTYDKTYDDGTHIRLTTHGEWIESYYRRELYNKAIFEKDANLFSNGHVFWSWLSREPVYSAAAEYDIDHGLTITSKQEDSCDFYHFGTSQDKPIAPEALANNLGILYRFIGSFREKAASLIKTAEEMRIVLPKAEVNKIIESSDLNKFYNNSALADFLKKTEVRRLYLGEKFDNLYLTRREIDIVCSLMEGKTSVEIASSLALSARTLEVHISHVKEKFKCSTLFELGFILGSLGPENLYPFKVKTS